VFAGTSITCTTSPDALVKEEKSTTCVTILTGLPTGRLADVDALPVTVKVAI
jgi:hypothetical protein